MPAEVESKEESAGKPGWSLSLDFRPHRATRTGHSFPNVRRNGQGGEGRIGTEMMRTEENGEKEKDKKEARKEKQKEQYAFLLCD